MGSGGLVVKLNVSGRAQTIVWRMAREAGVTHHDCAGQVVRTGRSRLPKRQASALCMRYLVMPLGYPAISARTRY